MKVRDSCLRLMIYYEARENLNHDEYVEKEDYYNVDSDDYDIDAN